MVGGIRENRSGRVIALGAIHGYLRPLEALVRELNLEPRDTLVVLGDMIDHGPDSSGVLAFLMGLRDRTRLIHLQGDHEDHLLRVVSGQAPVEGWIAEGGQTTLQSYQAAHPSGLPAGHLEFLMDARLSYTQGNHLFAHGGYLPHWPLPYTPREILLGQTPSSPDRPHYSGNTVVLGHTPQPDREVLDLGFAVCLETNCHHGRWLTALDLGASSVIQANRKGKVRRAGLYVRF